MSDVEIFEDDEWLEQDLFSLSGVVLYFVL